MLGARKEYSGTNSYKYVEPLIRRGRRILIVSPYIDPYYARFLLKHSKGREIDIISSSIDKRAEKLLTKGNFPGTLLSLLVIFAGLSYLAFATGSGIIMPKYLPLSLLFATLVLAVAFSYRLKRRRPKGIRLKIPREFVHVKLYVNERTAISGSANLTYRGMHKNVEHLQISNSEKESKEAARSFWGLWKRF
ncbi:MAG: phospholipase D-like domain-containing protein [Candidatus Micrarchaeia archaeon]